MHVRVVIALKVLLVVLLAILVACQIFLVPSLAAVTAAKEPQVAYLQVPGVIVADIFLLCVQIALLCLWRLLSLVAEETIFSPRSYLLVDTILALVLIATGIVITATIGLLAFGIGSGSVLLVCLLGVVLGLSSALLVVVLRGLVRKAAALEHDLSEVV